MTPFRHRSQASARNVAVAHKKVQDRVMGGATAEAVLEAVQILEDELEALRRVLVLEASSSVGRDGLPS